jgi:hypothetical protein
MLMLSFLTVMQVLLYNNYRSFPSTEIKTAKTYEFRKMDLKKKRKPARNQEIIDYVNNLHADSLDLRANEIDYIKSRWLKLFLWMDKAAVDHKLMHYIMRLIMAIGGVFVPVLVSANNPSFRLSTLGIGLIVAISTAIDELFRYKDYWYHHRTNAELLRSEGWQFFQKIGRYEKCLDYKEAFPTFAQRIEMIAQSSVESFLSNIIQEKENVVNKNIKNSQDK